MPEPVTITPHDPRRTAFRAIVSALREDTALAGHVEVWSVRDGTFQDDVAIERTHHGIMLTPVFEAEKAVSVRGSVRTWECPVTVKIEARVASANVDNVLNLAGLIEDAVMSISQADLRTAGISWLELVSPAAQAVEHGTSEGAFRFVVHIER